MLRKHVLKFLQTSSKKGWLKGLKSVFIPEDMPKKIKNNEMDVETRSDSNEKNLQDILEAANQLGLEISVNE